MRERYGEDQVHVYNWVGLANGLEQVRNGEVGILLFMVYGVR